MSAAGDDDEEERPARLFDEARDLDPRARQWADKEIEYVTRIAKLEAEREDLKQKLERLRRKVHRAAEKKVGKP